MFLYDYFTSDRHNIDVDLYEIPHYNAITLTAYYTNSFAILRISTFQ